MAALTITWSNTAIDDLQAIREFLLAYSDELANRIIERIIERVDVLKKGFPEIGPLEPLLSDHPGKPRFLVEGNYKIIYRADINHVFILAVFDSRQNPERLIERFE